MDHLFNCFPEIPTRRRHPQPSSSTCTALVFGTRGIQGYARFSPVNDVLKGDRGTINSIRARALHRHCVPAAALRSDEVDRGFLAKSAASPRSAQHPLQGASCTELPAMLGGADIPNSQMLQCSTFAVACCRGCRALQNRRRCFRKNSGGEVRPGETVPPMVVVVSPRHGHGRHTSILQSVVIQRVVRRMSDFNGAPAVWLGFQHPAAVSPTVLRYR